MPISALGYVGIGLVWGWWIGGLEGRVTRPFLDGLAVSLATLIFSLGIVAQTGWWALWFFLGAGGLALYLHLAWRQELTNHFRPTDYNSERR